jgi:uncharacterized membrane protein
MSSLQSSVTNANPADYSNAAVIDDWQNAARLVLGGTLIGYGLLTRSKTGLTIAAVGGGLVAMNFFGRGDEESEETPLRKRVIRRAITILKPQEEVYDFWADPKNLERIFPNIESITPLPDHKWRWLLRAVGSVEFTFETEPILNDRPHTMSWKTVQEAPLEHAGSVTFRQAPGGKGTEVQLTISWLTTSALTGAVLPFLGKGSDWHASESLRRAKQLLEAGELSTAKFSD